MAKQTRYSSGKAGTNRTNQTVKITDDIYLVIGFEVNGGISAYNVQTNTHNFMKDPGHAFFFTVKNGSVVSFLSFGPDDDISQLTPKQQISARPATTQYIISETSHLFKFKISSTQLNAIQKNTELFTSKVNANTIKYDFSKNITCAERAKKILDDSKVKTPKANGKIYIAEEAGEYIGNTTLWGEYVNPYSWYHFIKNTYGKGIKHDQTTWFLYKNYDVLTNDNFYDLICANYHGDLSN